MHGQEGFHQGHSDLVGLKRHHGAIAADDLVARQGLQGRGLLLMARQAHQAGCG